MSIVTFLRPLSHSRIDAINAKRHERMQKSHIEKSINIVTKILQRNPKPAKKKIASIHQDPR